MSTEYTAKEPIIVCDAQAGTQRFVIRLDHPNYPSMYVATRKGFLHWEIKHAMFFYSMKDAEWWLNAWGDLPEPAKYTWKIDTVESNEIE